MRQAARHPALRLFALGLSAVLVALSTHADPPATPPARYHYVLSRLQPAAIGQGLIGLGVNAASFTVTPLFFYATTGSATAAATSLLSNVITLPIFALPQSSGSLLVNHRIRGAAKSIQEFAALPHLENVRILTVSGRMEFLREAKAGGIPPALNIATRYHTKDLVFLETSEPLDPDHLPSGWGKNWGLPIEVDGLESTRLRVELMKGERASPLTWEPTLQEVFDNTPVVRGVAGVWREEIEEFAWQNREARRQLGQTLRQRVLDYFNGADESSLRLRATLVLPNGIVRPLENLSEGKELRKLLKRTFLDRFLNRVRVLTGKQAVLSGPLRMANGRAIDWNDLVGQARRREAMCIARGLRDIAIGHTLPTPDP